MKHHHLHLQLLNLLLLLLLITSQSKTPPKHQPCKHIVLYYHDILFGGFGRSDPTNTTSAAVTNASTLGNFFGMLVVFDDPVTKDQHFQSPIAARAQGMYFYDNRKAFGAWFAYTLVFNTSEYRGTLNVMGADPIKERTRDLSVVGGTGDFFMARGIVTFMTDALEGTEYFGLKMDVKLFECY